MLGRSGRRRGRFAVIEEVSCDLREEDEDWGVGEAWRRG